MPFSSASQLLLLAKFEKQLTEVQKAPIPLNVLFKQTGSQD